MRMQIPEDCFHFFCGCGNGWQNMHAVDPLNGGASETQNRLSPFSVRQIGEEIDPCCTQEWCFYFHYPLMESIRAAK
jgi:hypothetical protein